MLSQALSFLRKPRPIVDGADLVDFVESRAAFLVQKSIMDYARARSGPYFTTLLKEEDFRAAVERSRWRLFPTGLALVGEMVEAFQRGAASDVAGGAAAMAQVAAAAMDRHPVPEVMEAADWRAARAQLVAELERLSGRAPKPVKDMPLTLAETVFDNLPIHENRRGGDFEVVRNHLRSNLCAMHEELEKRISPADLAALLLRAFAPTPA